MHRFGLAQLAWTYGLKIPIGRPKKWRFSGPKISAISNLHLMGINFIRENSSSMYKFMTLERA